MDLPQLSDFPIWLVLALLAVVGKTSYYILQKRLLDADDSSVQLGFVSAVYGFIFIAPIGAYKLLQTTVPIDVPTILIIIGLGVIELIGLLVYLEALGATEISIASPLKKTKPVLISILEPFVLGIMFNPLLIVAASLTGVGGFIVLADDLDWKSLRSRLDERGPKLAVLAALIYTVLSLGSRFGNEAVGPFIFGGILFTVMLVGYYILLKRLGQHVPKEELLSRDYALVGITGVGRSIFVWGAYALASATVVSSITQLTILLDVVIGGHLFSEGNLRQKTVGATMILIGVIVVVLI